MKYDKVLPKGYITLLEMFMDEMLSKKKIGNYNDYKEAKADVLMSIANSTDNDYNLLEHLIDNTEKFCQLHQWFNDL